MIQLSIKALANLSPTRDLLSKVNERKEKNFLRLLDCPAAGGTLSSNKKNEVYEKG